MILLLLRYASCRPSRFQCLDHVFSPVAAVHDKAVLCSCKAEELVMIGDRYLTDVVYGNRNGLFTIRPAPLTLEGEPSAVLFVSQARLLV